MADLDLNSIPSNGAEAEALIQGFQEPAAADAIETPAQPQPTEYAIKYKGKEEKYPIEKLIEFAQQGRHYSDSMAKLKADRESFEKLSKTNTEKWAKLEARLNQYSEIEAYQQKDPAWWQHVVEQYQQKLSGQAQGANASPDPRFHQLEETVKQLASNLEQREQAQLAEKEDLALSQQVESYREKYPQFDWTTVDENGQDLEKRILDHGIKMGLTKPEHFRIAANDYLHDEFVKRSETSAKEGVAKHLKKVTELGLGPVTDRKTLAIKPVSNPASKTWDQISEEAKAAMGVE